jgi:predicted nucleic acid-binding protein
VSSIEAGPGGLNVVDSSGWIEYFQDSPRADLFATAVEDRAHLVVPTIALFEVCKILSRSLDATVVDTCLNVMRMGRVVDFTDARAISAARISRAHGLALADAAMYGIAQELNATFWTQDVDYQGLPGVEYLAKA